MKYSEYSVLTKLESQAKSNYNKIYKYIRSLCLRIGLTKRQDGEDRLHNNLLK